MLVDKYKTILDEGGYPKLIKENVADYRGFSFRNPESIVQMMNDTFGLDRQTEEFLYELCFSTSMNLIGVFEVSHGTINHTAANPREIFQKALLCGAASIILIHNHPSGDTYPSKEDIRCKDCIEKAGNLLGVYAMDNIIVGRNGDYLSFKEMERYGYN